MQFKKTLFILMFLMSGFAYSEATVYNIDPLHTSVTWHISHFGFSNPSGKWMVESGILILDEKNLNNSKVSATIQIDDINSGIQKLDNELIGNQFFNATQFPTAVFKSVRVKQVKASKLLVLGDLTLHGVTKPVTLDVTLNKIAVHPMAMRRAAGFSATAKIKRSDFGIKAYLPGLGDMVDLLIDVEAVVPPTVK